VWVTLSGVRTPTHTCTGRCAVLRGEKRRIRRRRRRLADARKHIGHGQWRWRRFCINTS
jgi:hypothetical protein